MPEKVTRKVGLPWRVEERLDAEEREWFVGKPFTAKRGKPHYSCLRTELNAFTGPTLIDYIERGLERENATTELVPPIEVINARVAAYHGTRARFELTAQIQELLGLEDLVSELMGATGGLKVPRGDIVKALANNPPVTWGRQVDDQLGKLLGDRLAEQAQMIIKRAVNGGE